MNVLLLYSTREGQTKKIANRVFESLNSMSFLHCEMTEISSNFDKNLLDFDWIIVGSSIRYGKLHKNFLQFSKKYANLLNNKKTAFYCVNLVARKPEKQTPETNSYTRKFLQKTKWKPNIVAVFAGALYYPRYHFFDRIMIQFIMKITGGDTDKSKEIEYTNWDQVDQFIFSIKKQILLNKTN